jgi:ribosomal protein L28
LNWKIKLKKIKIVQNSQEKKLEIKITSIKLKKISQIGIEE